MFNIKDDVLKGLVYIYMILYKYSIFISTFFKVVFSHNIFVFFDILIIICLFAYIFINNT